MTETLFDPASDLIYVEAKVWGPMGQATRVRLALDTGAVGTTLLPEVVYGIGYSPRDGGKIFTVSSALGQERGYQLQLSRLEALGYNVDNFTVEVFDLADTPDFDGLIGLSFLRQFNYEIRSREGRILVDRALS